MLEKEALAIIEPAATRVRDPKTGRSIWMAKLIVEAKIVDNTIKIYPTQHKDTCATKNNFVLGLECTSWLTQLLPGVLLEDDSILVLSKPSGLPVLRSEMYCDNTVIAYLEQRRPKESPTPVHRLGVGTSGTHSPVDPP